jgi:hypothetical protein
MTLRVFRWRRRSDQQVRTQRGLEQPVAGIEQFAGKIHLGNKPLELAMNLEVNMGWAHPARTRGIGARFDGFDPIDAIVIRSNVNAPDEIRVEWRRVGVVVVRVFQQL